MDLPLYLVRHGESEWNLRRLTQGQTRHPRLTERGRRQAEDAAGRLRADLWSYRGAPCEIVSSDLVRAVETAEEVAKGLGVPVRTDPRLREQHLGSLEGRTYEETFAAAEQHDWSDPGLPIFGGESLRQVQSRMRDFMASLRRPCVTVAISHGDAIRAALAHAEGHEPHRAPWIEVANGSIAKLEAGAVSWL